MVLQSFMLRFLVTALLLLGGGLSGCREKTTPKEAVVIRPVRSVVVESTSEVNPRTFAGTAKAVRESRLSFKVDGTLQEITVKVGDWVEADDVIARLDPIDYVLRVQEAEASLRRTQAEARNADANYNRVRALYENRNASRNDLDAARAGAESSRAAVSSIEKQLELAHRQLSYTRLTAPSHCAVAEIPAEINENVSPGQPVVIITCGRELEVQVALPEQLITRLREGDSVKVRFDAVPNMLFPAHVTEVGIRSSQMDTTFPVTVQLDETDERLLSGMAAEVIFYLQTGDHIPRIVVPSFAVGEDRVGRFVFVVKPIENGLGQVERRPVNVGLLVGSGMEIVSGLQGGERVVTAGITRITDGLRVRLNGEP